MTDADEAVEATITAALEAAFPGAVVIGEESAHRDPGLLQSIAAAELALVIDPIDGTRNFTAS